MKLINTISFLLGVAIAASVLLSNFVQHPIKTNTGQHVEHNDAAQK